MATTRNHRLDQDTLLAAAERLVAERGWDGLTMAALADELHVRAPSLYRHVDSLDSVRNALRLRTVVELGDAVRGAVMGKSGAEGLHALTDAYRDYARAHPVRYLAQGLLPGDAAMRDAGRRVGEAAYAVLASFGLAPDELPTATAPIRQRRARPGACASRSPWCGGALQFRRLAPTEVIARRARPTSVASCDAAQ